MSARLSFAVQAHPSRAWLAEALASELGGCEVVYDPDPDNSVRSPWRTYRLALELTPPGVSHRVVVQDDAEVCPHFAAAARLVCTAAPDRLVAFFVAGAPALYAHRVWKACDLDKPFADLGPEGWAPAIALAWPAGRIGPLLEWVDAQSWPVSFCADDEIIGRGARATGLRCLATVPSLAEHPDVEKSVIGRRRAMGGADISRVAACYIDADCDARLIDWFACPELTG